MAKRMMMKEEMTCPQGACGPKCMLMWLLAAVFLAGGLWMIVGGALMQYSRFPWTQVFLWYLGGFVLWAIAKRCKMKACAMCMPRY